MKKSEKLFASGPATFEILFRVKKEKICSFAFVKLTQVKKVRASPVQING